MTGGRRFDIAAARRRAWVRMRSSDRHALLGRHAGLLAVSVMLALALAAPAAAHRDPVASRLAAVARAGALPTAQVAGYRSDYAAAVRAVRRLSSVRRRELASVVGVVRSLAARRALTVSRMPLVFLTLRRNTRWWRAHGPPAAGSPGEPGVRGRRCRNVTRARAARRAFVRRRLVFRYYPGRGLQLHVNGTFAAANALLSRGTPASLAAAGRLLDRMRTLASVRHGQLTWEYEFAFGGARPPWASALAQGTAIEAYTTAGEQLGRPGDLDFARRLVGLFERRAPAGVSVPLGRDGRWYALYTFAPHLLVLNAQLGAVIGLHHLGTTGDRRAAFLAREGLRAVRRRIARFDTGSWSRYAQSGSEATLNYHVLNRDLARKVCQRVGQRAICRAWHRFAAQLERRCPRVAGASSM